MSKPVNIRALGLRQHVNAWCQAKGLPYSYADLEKWIADGEAAGDPVSVEWLRRRFKTSRPTMIKWQTIYKEQQNG